MNDAKTHLCRIPQERFDFLGYTFGRCYSHETGRAYIGTRPSRKSIKRMVEGITQETDRRRTLLDAEFVVGRLNRKLTGWANYFCLGPVSPAYRAINTHVTQRLRRWLCKKHKVSGTGWVRYPNQYLYEQLGLINLPETVSYTHLDVYKRQFRNCGRRYMPKRRKNPGTGSTSCTTRFIDGTCSTMPIEAAKPTRERLEWMECVLKTSKRLEKNAGLGNWRNG